MFQPLAPKFNVDARPLKLALRIFSFRMTPLARALFSATLNIGGKGFRCASVGVAYELVCVCVCFLRTFFRQQSCRKGSKCCLTEIPNLIAVASQRGQSPDGAGQALARHARRHVRRTAPRQSMQNLHKTTNPHKSLLIPTENTD